MIRLLALAFVLTMSSLQAQAIRHIDVYGLRTVDRALVDSALQMRVGDSTQGLDRPAAAERLKAVDGIEGAVVIAMFIPGNEILLVGVLESSTTVLAPDAAPTGEQRLPAALVEAYDATLELGHEGIMRGVSGETVVDGHSFPDYEPAAVRTRELAELARAHAEQVRDVLRHAADGHHRAAAAKAIAYLDDKAAIVPDLARAMRDPEPAVRNNAIRALSILAGWANGQDDFAVELDPTPLIQLLDSLTWTDRNKAAALLDSLSVGRDPALFGALRASALPALAEMARWHSSGHAIFSVRILGRMAGLDEAEIMAGDREARQQGDAVLDQWVDALVQRAGRSRADG